MTSSDADTSNVEPRLMSLAESYVDNLLMGDAGSLAAMVGPAGKIEDYRFGRIEGAAGCAEFAPAFRDWLRDCTIEKISHLRTTATPSRVISEDIVFLKTSSGESLEWPIATVACAAAAPDSCDFFVYYTMWLLKKAHTKRPVIFDEPQIDTRPSELLQDYHRCLTTGDLDGLHAVLAQDIYLRQPSGPPYVSWGVSGVIEYFKGLFANGAPLMRSERITSDGRCTFLEFTVVGWDGTEWPEEDHQAGAGIWEVNNDGLMAAIRVYDDVQF